MTAEDHSRPHQASRDTREILASSEWKCKSFLRGGRCSLDLRKNNPWRAQKSLGWSRPRKCKKPQQDPKELMINRKMMQSLTVHKFPQQIRQRKLSWTYEDKHMLYQLRYVTPFGIDTLERERHMEHVTVANTCKFIVQRMNAAMSKANTMVDLSPSPILDQFVLSATDQWGH